MTTKYKIVTGFVLMILISAIIAFIGYNSLQNALLLQREFQRVSSFDVRMSELEKEIYATVYTLERFMVSRDTTFTDKAQTSIEEAQKLVHTSIALVSTEERRITLQNAEKSLQTNLQLLNRIKTNSLAAYAQYTDACLPSANVMVDILRTVYSTGRRTGNSEALFYANQMLDSMLGTGINMARYATGRAEADGKLTTDNLQNMDKALGAMRAVMTSEAGVRDYRQLANAFAQMQDGFKKLVALNTTADEDITLLRANFTELLAMVIKMNDVAAEANATFVAQANETGRSSTMQLITVSAGATVLGIALAVFIIINLVRTLSGMASYLNNVAAGNFSSKFTVKEKGEIGVMFQSIQKIPAILAEIITKCNHLSNDIASGRFRDRLNSSEFQGEFSNLAQAVNVVGDSYTTVFDSLPVGIMTVDSKLGINFLNRQASTMTGKTTGDSCQGAFDEKTCNSDKCFGRCSMRDDKSVEGEVSFQSDGHRKDLNVTGVPLHDTGHNVVGSMEILSDITEIRTQQDTMLKVAHQASEIADRVAAASEELSAQVEEVSRGAEMQRERVESTASAMTEMNSTVLEVARSASQASEQSEETRRNAQSGSELVNQVVDSINDINSIAAKLQENM
ncbi:PAS domain S-box protein, partial [Desulfovibrio sp. OttesenSCG-928-C06]|nr:PAS domain S-box protein [Desulfovibrio sp. OttesenSCG-928-C06]